MPSLLGAITLTAWPFVRDGKPAMTLTTWGDNGTVKTGEITVSESEFAVLKVWTTDSLQSIVDSAEVVRRESGYYKENTKCP